LEDQKAIEIKGTKDRKNFFDRRRLGDLLVETGLMTRDKLKEALQVQQGTVKRLGQVLVGMGFVTEEEIAFALAMQLKIPFIDLADYLIKTEVIESIPEEVCQKYICIPIDWKDNVLHVSMADPLDLNIIKDLQFITGFKSLL
jgi:type IV pilus assembly protein PilB